MRSNDWRTKNRVKSKKTYKVFAILAMFSFIAFIMYHLLLAVNITNEKLRILEIAQKDINELRIQNLELVLEKGDIVSIEYIEKEARDKLRYSREDEMVFVIPDSLLESEWVEGELEMAKGVQKNVQEKKPEEIFVIWKNFLLFDGV